MNYLFLLIPVISAIVGWICSWIASYLLIYRIIPKQKQNIAQGIAQVVNREFPFSTIEEKITDPETIKKIMPLVENHIDDFLRNKLKQKMPVISMFIGDKTVNSLKEVFLKEIEELFPQVLKQFAGSLREKVDVGELVAKKIERIEPGQVKGTLAPLLRYFQFAGLLGGLIIGLADVFIIQIIK